MCSLFSNVEVKQLLCVRVDCIQVLHKSARNNVGIEFILFFIALPVAESQRVHLHDVFAQDFGDGFNTGWIRQNDALSDIKLPGFSCSNCYIGLPTTC